MSKLPIYDCSLTIGLVSYIFVLNWRYEHGQSYKFEWDFELVSCWNSMRYFIHTFMILWRHAVLVVVDCILCVRK